MERSSSSINLNTVLLTIVLGIAGWTLVKVVSLSEAVATGAERDSAQASAMLDFRSRLVMVESLAQNNQLEIARLKSLRQIP